MEPFPLFPFVLSLTAIFSVQLKSEGGNEVLESLIYLLIISAFAYFILILYLAFILFLNNFQKR